MIKDIDSEKIKKNYKILNKVTKIESPTEKNPKTIQNHDRILSEL
jgi:hypothetical protein